MGTEKRLDRLAERLRRLRRDLTGLRAEELTDDELAWIATEGRVRRAEELSDEELDRIAGEPPDDLGYIPGP